MFAKIIMHSQKDCLIGNISFVHNILFARLAISLGKFNCKNVHIPIHRVIHLLCMNTKILFHPALDTDHDDFFPKLRNFISNLF